MSGARDGHCHVVLIAYHYPPAPTVGSFRAEKVARAFRDAGHRVEVVTARLPDEREGRRVDQPDYVVHAVTAWANPRHALAAIKRRLRGGTERPVAVNTQAGGVPQAVVESTPAWKRLVGSFLWLPDDMQGFIPPAVRCAQDAIRRGANLLYSTAPPFSDHLAALVVKGRTGVRWVAELRDPWTDNPDRPAHIRSAPADRANAWLEARVLRRADHVVAVSEATRELLVAKLPAGERGKVSVALNGIDPAPSTGPTPHGGPFRIVHAGSLYQDRDPRPFLLGLAAVVRERRLGPSDVRVDFVGNCRVWRGISVEAFAREHGLGGIIHFADWLPQAEARQLVADADLLVLFAQNSRYQILNKLYDYLAARRPILAFVDPDGEVAAMLERAGGHFVMTADDPTPVAAALATAMATRRDADWRTDDALLASWSTEAQMDRLLDALAIPRLAAAG